MLFDCIDAWLVLRHLAATTTKPTPYGIDLKNPFTMSKTLTALKPRYRCEQRICFLFISGYALEMVELIGIEPMT